MRKDRKEYLREYRRIWIKKRRDNYFQDKRCIKCGTIENLHLDHINPEEKTCHKIWSWREERRLKELEKCQILCGSCHQQKTNSDNNYSLKHGTVNGYDYYKCRCNLCKDAKVKKVNNYRWATGKRKKRSG